MSAESTQRNLRENARPEAEIIVVASSREQAGVMFREAEKIVKRSGTPEHAPRSEGIKGWWLDGELYEVKAGYREIRLGDSARLRVLAADANTADGVIPTLALVDELHRHRSIDLYEVLAGGLAAPPPGGPRGSLEDFERFCSLLILDDGKPMELEEHERKILRLYFAGYTEIVVLLPKKNGKTTLMGGLGLYHLKTGTPVRQMITISTAGTDEGSPLGKMRKQAHEMEEFRRRGKVNTVKTEDKSFAWLEWCLDSEDDLTDIELVKKVNPASWHSVESLGRWHKRRTPGAWARLHCNVWGFSDEPWIEAAEWDNLAVDIGGVVEGEKVWAAVLPGEGAAIALAAPRPDDVAVVTEGDFEIEVSGAAVKVWIFDSPSLAQLEAQLLNLAKVYDIQSVLYDPREFQRSAELLEGQGLEMMDEPGTALRWSMASVSLKRLIDARVLRHGGDRALRDQVLQADTKETEQGWRLVKSAGSKGVVAMATAVHHATQVDSGPVEYLAI